MVSLIFPSFQEQIGLIIVFGYYHWSPQEIEKSMIKTLINIIFARFLKGISFLHGQWWPCAGTKGGNTLLKFKSF